MSQFADISFLRLTAEHAEELSRLLRSGNPNYNQFFTPFSFEANSLRERLGSAREDRYWGILSRDILAGFCMLRGFDEGYQRPTFGVFIGENYANQGLSALALRYCMSWCRLNQFPALMLKVHPDNTHARQVYEQAGFRLLGIDPHNQNYILEKTWEK